MRSLIKGIEEYERLSRPHLSERFAELAHGQSPHALFLTCSDSRVVPSLLASAGPGELFVVRNVANQVPPSTPEAPDVGADSSVSSAVWYALEVLKVKDVVVCGHSGCGGVKALLSGAPPSPSLERWLAAAAPLVEQWRATEPTDDVLPPHDRLSQFVTRAQLDNLMTYSFVRERVLRGEVRLHSWWFDISAGVMLAWSEAARAFVPALEALSERETQVRVLASAEHQAGL
ncbi:MAG: carbonic anhydrase [Archangium sp.]|nr:carbonic anhydrase [Archangium sp.]MDP3154524.1 carbonic anhydrase [Archangium sp.]MDP3569437.1 carbonic anhydrase [Archangium sp.]